MPPTPIRVRRRSSGEFVGPYQIEEPLGTPGGFGETYLVEIPIEDDTEPSLQASRRRLRSPFQGVSLTLKLFLPAAPEWSLARVRGTRLVVQLLCGLGLVGRVPV